VADRFAVSTVTSINVSNSNGPRCRTRRRACSTTREVFSRVVLQSAAAAFGVPSTAPGRGHPTTYMITAQESDNCIPVAAQEAMAANVDEVVRLPAAHMAQLSRPDELADALGRI
jgi:hypothetical protein